MVVELVQQACCLHCLLPNQAWGWVVTKDVTFHAWDSWVVKEVGKAGGAKRRQSGLQDVGLEAVFLQNLVRGRYRLEFHRAARRDFARVGRVEQKEKKHKQRKKVLRFRFC